MRPSFVSYVLVALWAVWLAVATGLLVELSPRPRWVPDLLLVTLVSTAARANLDRVRVAALIFAVFRAGLGSDPLAAVAAGYLAWVEFQSRVARVFDLQSAVARGVLAWLGAWVVGAWLLFVRGQRAPLPVSESAGGAFGSVWAAALTAGIAASLLGGLLAGLPGLTALKERPWEAAGRSR